MNHSDVSGFFNFHTLYNEAVAAAPDDGILVEVGCWYGRSVIYLAEQVLASKKNIRVFAVDTWRGSVELLPVIAGKHPGFVWHSFVNNIRACGVQSVITPMCLPSVEAATLVEDGTISMVFIDADHDYASVKADIAAWRPKVKANGILAGHDYSACWAGVRQAVDEAFSGNVIIDPVSVTWIAKL